MATIDEIVAILNSSKTPPELPPATSLGNSDLVMFWNTTTNKLNAITYNNLFNLHRKPVENRYDNISGLLLDVSNQTSGYLQFVTDATDDPQVDLGSAYYEYLGTTNGDLTDYRKLSAVEVAIIQEVSTIIISGLPFELIKNKSIPNDVGGVLENDDIIKGFEPTGEYIQAKYLGGDETDFFNEAVYKIYTGI